MKLLLIHSGTDLYGASRSLLRLSSRLLRDGHTVQVILPAEGVLKNELQACGANVTIYPNLVTITRSGYHNRKNSIGLAFRIIQSGLQLSLLVKKINPDLVHSMTAVLPGSGMAAFFSGKPHFWHIRESFDEFPTLWKFYRTYIFLLSKRILCVSTPIANQFATYQRKKVVVLHNGFPIQEFQPVSQERLVRTREAWGIFPDSIAIGVVGRIKFKRKGQEIFVQAASLLKKKYSNARFLCIGSPFPGNENHLEELMNLVKKLDLQNEFIYTGDAIDIKAALASLDILVLSSVQPEPFGGVVVEAMAYKKPVVATAIGGSLEQVVDGKTGFLVEPGNAVDMAAAIGKMLDDKKLRVQMGLNGYQRYLENFEFEPFYQKICCLYEEAIHGI